MAAEATPRSHQKLLNVILIIFRILLISPPRFRATRIRRVTIAWPEPRMSRSKTFRITFAAAIYTVVSASLFTVELIAFDRSHGNSLGPPTGAIGTRILPNSHVIRRDVLDRCDRSLTPPASLVKTGSALERVAIDCRNLATNLLNTMPTDGFSHYILAIASDHLRQIEQSAEMLARSAQLAPFEGWLIQRRVAFALRELGRTEALNVEMSALLTTQKGAEYLAAQYLHHPENRTLIMQALKPADTLVQVRFVNQLTKQQAQM